MKVSTRIILGFATLLLVAFAALAYQVSIIYTMQTINQNLSSVNFSAAATIQKLEATTIVDLEDYSKKYFARNGDVTYEELLADVRLEFSDEISQLESKSRVRKEKDAIAELSKESNDFWNLFVKAKARINPDGENEMPHSLQDALDNIRTQARLTSSAIQSSIQTEVHNAEAAGIRAKTVSLIAGAASLLIAVIVAILLVRAIADPLRQLTHGTRRISKGQFWHRLPIDGPAEFAELARDFNSMAQRLSELDEMKKGFISHVSHELKAPLASMRQVFLLMLQEIAGPLNDQQRKLLRLSSNSAERLSSMVGNLLDVSRMEAGAMEYDIHPQDVVALVRLVADEFEVQANEKRIALQLECGSEAWAECDRDRIVQVIGNLFENALKFAPEGSRVTARVQMTDAHKVLVSVSDSGPGVPPEHKERIFEKFHQVKKGKKINGQGVGLGLAICRTIIDAHHGQIWVEDNPSGGSVFCFMLNAAGSHVSPPADPISVAGQSR